MFAISTGLETDPYFKNQANKRTLKGSFLSRRALEIEGLAETQFVIDSCCLFGHLNCLNNCYVTRMVIGVFWRALSENRCTLMPIFLIWKIVWLKIFAECVGKLMGSLS